LDPLPHNRQIQPTTPKSWLIISLTKQPHIPVTSSHIKQATWSLLDTAMTLTFWRLLHVQHQQNTQQQWHSPHNLPDHQSGHVISGRCRNWRPLHQLQISHPRLGHKQPPTPMQTDNFTALGVVNNNVMKNLKAVDMKYHWL
jgi:hypothetical protein